MNRKIGKLATFVAAMALALSFVSTASAQVFNGRIDVTVEDSTGGRLPGVSVDVTGPVTQTQITDAQGQAHFINVSVGTYSLKATLSGFNVYTNSQVVVVAGAGTPVGVRMSVQGTKETVNVTAATPIIDTRKQAQSTNISLEELQNVPSGRDPWVVMQTVPGIIVDRVNVGGSETGQQSGFQAKGAIGADATWNLDGIAITDMAATGSTPAYYDFDMFQEMNITTGGSDMTTSTGGVHLNFVLKSGQNTPHGSTRLYFENESMQGNNMDPALATALGSPNGKGNRIDHYYDYGGEIGGPIVKDRLWAWGSLAKTDIKVLTITQTPDATLLKQGALKVQAQATTNLRASFTYFKSDKSKFGRSASATRPPETTVDQGSSGPGFFKGEANFVAGDSLFFTVRGAHFPSGFFLTPEGGLSANTFQDDSAVWHGSYADYRSTRPLNTLGADGSWFTGKHEIKYGFSWRKNVVNSMSVWPGNKTITFYNGYPNLIVEADADHPTIANLQNVSGFVGDTITMNRLTANFGIRIDHQSDGVDQMTSNGVTFGQFGTYLPTITAPAVPNAITWNSVSPRIGITYGLDSAHKTQARASYAMFASQLGNGASAFVSVIQYRYVAFDAVDTKGQCKVGGPCNLDPSSINFNSMEYAVGFDPAHPSNVDSSINKIGNYTVPKTHEFILGIDHELAPDFGVSASFTYRKMVDFDWQPHIGVRSTNFIQGGTFTATGLPDGSNASVPFYYVPASSLSSGALANGREYVTRDGYHQRYLGFETAATKRLSNKWMARLAFSTNKHQEFFDNRATSIENPTPSPTSPLVDGGLVVTSSTGSGKSGIYELLPLYQLIGTGSYQAPHGVDVGFNYNMRQGFGQPWYRTNVSNPNDYFSKTISVLATDVSQHRLDSVQTLDLRVGWDLGRVLDMGHAHVNVDLDIFNVFNADTVLGRQYDLRRTGATGFNQTLEIVNPRIMRLGARVNF